MNAPERSTASLTRILGFGFSVALSFGNMIGVGILRLPGSIAAALGDVPMIIAVWIAGGVYALLGAISVAELASMVPLSGGFYVYARRVFGPRLGFLAGWNDWIANIITIAYAVLTARDFIVLLVPALAPHGLAIALALLAAFTTLHWLGVRIGGGVQNAISAAVGLMLVTLAAGAFFVASPAPVAAGTIPGHGAPTPFFSVAMVVALVSAMRSVFVTYDGWYGAIYLAEETVDAPRAIPRAMITCAVLVTALYLFINAGFLHALSLAALASSTLPAADVARLIFPRGGSELVTVVSLCTVLSLTNAVMLAAPRVLFAIARDGLLGGRAARVSAGGTPSVALAITAVAVAGLILSGTLEQLIDVAAVLFVVNYVFAYSSMIALRRREPDAERPFRAYGYPWTTGLVLVGSLLFLGAAVVDQPRTGAFAAILLGAAVPVYAWLARRGRTTRPMP